MLLMLMSSMLLLPGTAKADLGSGKTQCFNVLCKTLFVVFLFLRVRRIFFSDKEQDGIQLFCQ